MPADDAIWINSEKFWEVAKGDSASAVSIVMDLVMGVWWPAMHPIPNDAKWIFETLNKELPARGYTLEKVEQSMPVVRKFMCATSEGGLVPSADLFIVNDPDAEKGCQ